MPNKTPKQAFLDLEQLVLSAKDNNLFLNNFISQILTAFDDVGFDYSLINIIFLDPRNQPKKVYFLDKNALGNKGVDDQNLIILQNLFSTSQVYEKEMLWGHIQIVSQVSELLNQAYPGIAQLKNLVICPVIIAKTLSGIIILATSREAKEISEEEKDLVMMVTNLVALSYKLQDAQESLTHVTEEVYKMNAKLHQLDKLKDDFVSIASHELRTPMTAIRSYSWMALHRSDIPLSEKLTKYLERTLISTERLINLVNDMLNVSRIESGRVEIYPEAFDIVHLVGEVLIEVEAKAKEKNLVITNNITQIPQIFADANKVHQVLLNLIGNSLKFTQIGGQIAINYFSDGKTITISVQDNGVGISKEDQARLFKKFSRLDDSYVAASSTGGTGLGLFICKSLIERQGGKIWVSSEGKGKGSTFSFSLPVATQELLQESEKFHYRPPGGAKLMEPVAIQAFPNEPA